MKNNISVTIIFLLIGTSLFSQIKTGDKEISLNINLFNSNHSINATPIKTTTMNLNFNTGLSGRYYLEDFLSIGIGFNYNWSYTIAVNKIYTDSITQETILSNTTKSFISSIKLGSDFKIFNHLYIKGCLNANLGTVSFSEETSYSTMDLILPGYYNIDNYTNIKTEEFEKTGKFNYISIAFKPKFQYYFNNKIGVTLGLGGIEYFTNKRLFLFSFGPAYWTLGMDIKFNS